MKKLGKLLYFLVFSLILVSCGGEAPPERLLEEVRESFSGPFSVVAEVKADYGERVHSFTLRYTGSEVTILAPESVSGITAKLGEDGVTLSYDGAEVFTGALTDKGLSPVSALPVMAEAWRGGIVTRCGYEKEGLMAEYYISEGVALKTLFERETLLPLSAEIISGGFTVITAEFHDVVM